MTDLNNEIEILQLKIKRLQKREKKKLKELELSKKHDALKNEVKKNMSEKRYFCTIYQVGNGKKSKDREVDTGKYYKVCSTIELQDLLKRTQGFWTHPDRDKVWADEIPRGERKYGRYTDVIIEPFTKELEERYLNAREEGLLEKRREFRDLEVRNGLVK
jgi:hypothetical protein